MDEPYIQAVFKYGLASKWIFMNIIYNFLKKKKRKVLNQWDGGSF